VGNAAGLAGLSFLRIKTEKRIERKRINTTTPKDIRTGILYRSVISIFVHTKIKMADNP